MTAENELNILNCSREHMREKYIQKLADLGVDIIEGSASAVIVDCAVDFLMQEQERTRKEVEFLKSLAKIG